MCIRDRTAPVAMLPIPVSRSRRSFWVMAAAVAMLAIGVGITTWSMREMRHSDQALPVLGWMPPARDAVVTREPNPAPENAPMQKGMEAYERRDYETAARLLGRATMQG